jgi:nucleotide-binding universal stress UspA family protein
MLHKILIATGDSEESEQILESGLKLAEKFGAEILLLHVLNLFQSSFETVGSPFMGGMYPISNDLDIQQHQKEWQVYEKIGTERLQSYAQQANDRSIKAEIFQNIGDAGRMICETAKNGSVDLIVMGRNQRSALSEMFLGSTSNYILHHAPCSITVIQHT